MSSLFIFKPPLSTVGNLAQRLPHSPSPLTGCHSIPPPPPHIHIMSATDARQGSRGGQKTALDPLELIVSWMNFSK